MAPATLAELPYQQDRHREQQQMPRKRAQTQVLRLSTRHMHEKTMPRIPNAKTHSPTPQYVQALLRRIAQPNHAIAAALGCGVRTIERWAADGRVPYAGQFALEVMAEAAEARRRKRTRDSHPLDGIAIASDC